MNDDRRRSGNAMPALLLLVLLIGLGGYNYYRNLQAEKLEGPRPFEGYTTEDLTQLRNAYGGEVEQYEKRYAAQQKKRYRARGEGLMDQRVDEFERIQRNSGRIRELSADVAERQARLRELDHELDYRLALKTGFALHLKRLTSI